MEIRNILVNYKILKKELEKQNITGNQKIQIRLEMLEESIKNLLLREQEDLQRNIENNKNNLEILREMYF